MGTGLPGCLPACLLARIVDRLGGLCVHSLVRWLACLLARSLAGSHAVVWLLEWCRRGHDEALPCQADKAMVSPVSHVCGVATAGVGEWWMVLYAHMLCSLSARLHAFGCP